MLNLARYRFTFRVTESIRLPDYAGSALRGIFGHALRQVSCVTKEKNCVDCPLVNQCPYSQIFEPHQISHQGKALKHLAYAPVPYIIEAPLTTTRIYQVGSFLSFDMVLMGAALEQLAIIILAWRRAFLRGIGAQEGKAELVKIEKISGNYCVVYTEENPIIVPHDFNLESSIFNKHEDIHLHLLTPLRLQQKGKILSPRDMTASIFLRQLIRRVTFQEQLNNPSTYPIEKIRELNDLADQVEDDRRLVWRDWERYSSRQKKAMKLGGVVGHWYFKNVPVALLPFIYLGELLHVGKETSFGLGHYRVTQEAWQPIKHAENVEGAIYGAF